MYVSATYALFSQTGVHLKCVRDTSETLANVTLELSFTVIKVFHIHIYIFFCRKNQNIMEELQWKMPIQPFVDSWWLLYTQPIMSKGNTADMEIRRP